MSVRTAVILPFRKGSREKGEDYFGSLLPSLQLLFGLLLMPAGFSQEVGGKAGGRGGGVQAARISSTTGRKSNEQEPTFLRGHRATQTAGRERGSSQFRQTPLYCSPPGGEKERNTPQPLGSLGTCPSQRTCLTSPPSTGLTFHWGEGFSHPVLGAGRATPPPFHKQERQEWIFLLDTQGNPQRTPSSCQPCHILLWPAKNTCPSPCIYKGHLSIPSTTHVSTQPRFVHILQ